LACGVSEKGEDFMKFIWNAPDPKFLQYNWEQAIVGWLNCNGVWFHRDPQHWECSYNDFHHFYDISIYECWLPGNGAHDSSIRSMREYLRNSGLDWQESPTFKWDDLNTDKALKRPGVRFWIQAEDHPRHK